MDVTPPPALDSRIEEWGDRLIVRYRRSDRWWAHGGTLLFLGFWGVCVVSSVLALFRGQLEGAVGVILWFAVGAFGGWHLFKTDVLTVTPAFVELRRELSGRSRTRRVDAARVRSVAAVAAKDSEGEPMSGFYVVVECSDRKKLRFSGRLGEREAEYIAQLVWLRLRPAPRGGTAWGWRGELEHAVESAEPEFVAPPSLRGVVRKALFPLLVVGAIVWLGLQTLHTQHARPQAEPTTPWRALPPVRRQPLRPEQQFADARSYASATTINLLRQSAQILGEVDCGAYPRWDDWECTVRARAVDGLYAGRAMLYFCKSEPPPQTGGRVIRCGPKHPPRIDSRRLMPQPSEFADASAYAGAVTAYALRSGRVVLLTKPDCGDVVTWSSWTCTARARATIGPYAGRSLTYRCSPDGDRSVTCGPMNPPPI